MGAEPANAPMKLHLTASRGYFTVTGHAPGRVDINGRPHERSVLVLPERIDADWGPERTEALAAAHLADLAHRRGLAAGKVLLLGTGERQRFPTGLPGESPTKYSDGGFWALMQAKS